MPPSKVSMKLPDLRLQERAKPLQKITLDRMPEKVLGDVKERAFRLQQKPANYVRIVLEHAERSENRSDYEKPLSSSSRTYNSDKLSTETLHVPLQSREFLQRLIKWAPYGLKVKRDIAMAILKRHLDVVKDW